MTGRRRARRLRRVALSAKADANAGRRFAMAFAEVNGAVVHYRDEGPRDARAIVFINALGTDLRIWDDLVASAGDAFRVVRYDKRGHGLSELPPGPAADDRLRRRPRRAHRPARRRASDHRRPVDRRPRSPRSSIASARTSSPRWRPLRHGRQDRHGRSWDAAHRRDRPRRRRSDRGRGAATLVHRRFPRSAARRARGLAH